MQLQITQRRKICFVILSFLMAAYLGLSALIGFPLGFGTTLAREIAVEYCNVVYPGARVEKTVFNPVNQVFETGVDLGEREIHLSTMPRQDRVGDNFRSQMFLQEAGVTDTISRLHRTYVSSSSSYRFLTCMVSWKETDPMTPMVTLRFDYADYETAILPTDAQIKEILRPIALDCILQVEEHLPLDRIQLLYYHPAFDPDEKSMTWRRIDLPLEAGIPRTNSLVDKAELRLL